jgi:hypothetical protein
MMQKIKSHFLKLGPRRFVYVTVCLLIGLDLLNGWYLKLYWEYKNLSYAYAMKVNEMSQTELDMNTVEGLVQLTDNMVSFFLLIMMINNLFFYFFYLRKKLWAQGYILFYTLTNAFLVLAFLFEGPVLGAEWFFFNLLSIPMYVYLYLGVKVLKYETTDAITPAGEMKAR